MKTCFSVGIRILLVTLALTQSMVSVLADPGPTFTVYGPVVVNRETEAPAEVNARFAISSTAAAPYVLHVLNGAVDGSNRVSSATISVNGTEAFGRSSFNQRVGTLEKIVALARENTLRTELASAPGSFLTLWITATDVTPPVLEVTSPRANQVTSHLEVQVAGRVTDETAVQVKVNGLPVAVGGDGAFAGNVPLVEGLNQFTIRAIDAAENATSLTRAVTRDTQAPVLTLSEPADETITTDAEIAVIGSVQDATPVILT